MAPSTSSASPGRGGRPRAPGRGRPAAIRDLERGPEWARWFTNGRLNYATSAVDAPAASQPHTEAIAWEGEDGAVRRARRAELGREGDRAAHAFAALGIVAGDRGGSFLPLPPPAARAP